MMSTDLRGITTDLNIHFAETGMVKDIQTDYSKQESKDIWGHEKQKGFGAEKQL